MYEVILVKNGAKAYVKNPRVFLREKSAKRGFMKSSSHSNTALTDSSETAITAAFAAHEAARNAARHPSTQLGRSRV